MQCKRCSGSGTEPNWHAMGTAARKVRLAKGIGVRALARAVQVSPSFICDLELGGRSWMGTKAREVLRFLGMRAA